MHPMQQLKQDNELRKHLENGKLIQLDKATEDKLKEERLAAVEKFTTRMGHVHNEDNQVLVKVVLAEVNRVGPAAVNFEACRALAEKISVDLRRQRWLDMKAVLKERGVKDDLPDEYVWAARLSGVELLEPPAPVVKAEE